MAVSKPTKIFLVTGSVFTILSSLSIFEKGDFIFSILVFISMLSFLLASVSLKLGFNQDGMNFVEGMLLLLSIIIYMFQTAIIFKYIIHNILIVYVALIILVVSLSAARMYPVLKKTKKSKKK